MRRFLYLLGNGHFDERSGISRLRYVHHDMARIAGLYRETLGFDRVKQRYDATAGEVAADMEEIGRFLTPDDLLVVYAIGHGVTIDGRARIVASDATAALLDAGDGSGTIGLGTLTWLPLSRVEGGTPRLVAMLDTCRRPVRSGSREAGPRRWASEDAGALARSVGTRDAVATRREGSRQDVPFLLIHSCREEMEAMEREEIEGGHFSVAHYEVVKALHGRGEPIVFGHGLKQRIHARMGEIDAEHGWGSLQEPEFLSRDAGDAVLWPGRASSGDDGAAEPRIVVPERPTIVVPERRAGPSPRRIPGFAYVHQNEQGYPEYRHETTGLVFVLLPGGTFLMGGSEAEHAEVLSRCGEYERAGVQHWLGWELPRHVVRVSSFLIAKHLVTQEIWEEMGFENRSHFLRKEANLPVESVSWDDARAFVDRCGLSLPTEAQWEYACRAGTTGATYAGALELRGLHDAPGLDAIAWYGGNSGVDYEGGDVSSMWREKQYTHERAGTHPVGKKRPNGFGLFDMLGLCNEWCEDALDENYYSRREAGDGDVACSRGSEGRVVRGGGWNSRAECCRSAGRSWDPPGSRGGLVGFRPSFHPLP